MLFGAFDALPALGLCFYGVAMATYALNFDGVEDWCSGNALCCEADDVVELFDSLSAAWELESAGFVAASDGGFDPL